MIIDTNIDTAMVYECTIKVGTTSLGHYKLLIAPTLHAFRGEEFLLS